MKGKSYIYHVSLTLNIIAMLFCQYDRIDMQNVGIVVVTYNRLDCLKENLTSLMTLQPYPGVRYNIIIVNNHSTDGTAEYLSNLQEIEAINLDRNTGGSGGFYTGVKWCLDHGMDYIWGMDDDAYPDKAALQTILKAANNGDEMTCYWSNCNNDFDNYDEHGRKEVESWMFVGFFVPIKVVKQVGLPRDDFFIYHDDSEYAYRIRSHHYPIIKVKDSIIDHNDTLSEYYSGKRFLLYELKHFSILPSWKRYYDVRNMLLMYKKTDINFWKALIIFGTKTKIATKIYCPEQTKIVSRALHDGFFRINGCQIQPDGNWIKD